MPRPLAALLVAMILTSANPAAGSVSATPAAPAAGSVSATPAAPAAGSVSAADSGVRGQAPTTTPTTPTAPPLPTPTQDPGVTRAKIDEILAQTQFRQAQPNLIERLGTILNRWIAAVMTGLQSGGVGAAGAWAILATALAALVLVARRLARDVRADTSHGVVQQPEPTLRSPLEWRRLAESHEGRGEWRPALRCHYRALLADLVACRAIRDLPGRTSGEYRSEIDASVPAGAGDFAAASELFERAWYGTNPTGPDETGRFRELADRVLDRAGTR